MDVDIKTHETYEDEVESTRINWNPCLSLTSLISALAIELSAHGPGHGEVETKDLARVWTAVDPSAALHQWDELIDLR